MFDGHLNREGVAYVPCIYHAHLYKGACMGMICICIYGMMTR
jgi:hypothetical protein